MMEIEKVKLVASTTTERNTDTSVESNKMDENLTIIFNVGPDFFNLYVLNNKIERSFNYLYDSSRKIVILSKNCKADPNLPLLHGENHSKSYSKFNINKDTVLIVNIFKDLCICEKCCTKSVLFFGSLRTVLHKEILNILSSYVCIKSRKRWIDILDKHFEVIFNNFQDGVNYNKLLAWAIENIKTFRLSERVMDLMAEKYSYFCFHLYFHIKLFKFFKKTENKETSRFMDLFHGTGKEELDVIDGIKFLSFKTEQDLNEYTKMEELFMMKNKNNEFNSLDYLTASKMKRKSMKSKFVNSSGCENIDGLSNFPRKKEKCLLEITAAKVKQSMSEALKLGARSQNNWVYPSISTGYKSAVGRDLTVHTLTRGENFLNANKFGGGKFGQAIEDNSDLSPNTDNCNTYSVIPILHECKERSKVCICKTFSLGMVITLGYRRPLHKLAIENLETLKLTEEDEDDSDFEYDGVFSDSTRKKRSVMVKNKVSLRMAKIAASALYTRPKKVTRIVVPVVLKSILNITTDWNKKLQFDKLAETIPSCSTEDVDTEIRNLMSDMVDRIALNCINNELQNHIDLPPFEFVQCDSEIDINNGKEIMNLNWMSPVPCEMETEYILPDYHEDIDVFTKKQKLCENVSSIIDKEKILEAENELLIAQDPVFIDLVSNDDEQNGEELDKLVPPVKKAEDDAGITKKQLDNIINQKQAKRSIRKIDAEKEMESMEIIDLVEEVEDTELKAGKADEIVLLEENENETVERSTVSENDARISVDLVNDLPKLGNKNASSVIRDGNEIVPQNRVKSCMNVKRSSSGRRLLDTRKKCSLKKEMKFDQSARVFTTDSATEDTASDSTIDEDRLTFSVSQKFRLKSLWDVLIWCDVHYKYSCKCTFSIYQLKENILFWIKLENYEKCLKNVMSNIKLKGKPDKEILFYNSDQHSARTFGTLINYNLRNKSLIFKKKRYRELSAGTLSFTNSFVKMKNHYGYRTRTKEETELLPDSRQSTKIGLTEFIDKSDLDLPYVEYIDVYDARARNIPLKKFVITPEAENVNHLTEDAILAILKNDKNVTIYEGCDEPESLRSACSEIPLKRSVKKLKSDLKRKSSYNITPDNSTIKKKKLESLENETSEVFRNVFEIPEEPFCISPRSPRVQLKKLSPIKEVTGNSVEVSLRPVRKDDNVQDTVVNILSKKLKEDSVLPGNRNEAQNPLRNEGEAETVKKDNANNETSRKSEAKLLKVVPIEYLERRGRRTAQERRTWYQLPGTSVQQETTTSPPSNTNKFTDKLQNINDVNVLSTIRLAKKLAVEIKQADPKSNCVVHVNKGVLSIKDRSLIERRPNYRTPGKLETVDLTGEDEPVNHDSNCYLDYQQRQSLNDIIKTLDTGMDHAIVRVKHDLFKDITYGKDNLPKLALICSSLPELGYITVIDLKPTHLIVLDPEIPELVHSFKNINFANKWLNRLLKKCVGFELPNIMFVWIVVKPGILKIKQIPQFSSEILKSRSAFINKDNELHFLKQPRGKRRVYNTAHQLVSYKGNNEINQSQNEPNKKLKISSSQYISPTKSTANADKSSSVRLKIISSAGKKINFLNLNAVSSCYKESGLSDVNKVERSNSIISVTKNPKLITIQVPTPKR